MNHAQPPTRIDELFREHEPFRCKTSKTGSDVDIAVEALNDAVKPRRIEEIVAIYYEENRIVSVDRNWLIVSKASVSAVGHVGPSRPARMRREVQSGRRVVVPAR